MGIKKPAFLAKQNPIIPNEKFPETFNFYSIGVLYPTFIQILIDIIVKKNPTLLIDLIDFVNMKNCLVSCFLDRLIKPILKNISFCLKLLVFCCFSRKLFPQMFLSGLFST